MELCFLLNFETVSLTCGWTTVLNPGRSSELLWGELLKIIIIGFYPRLAVCVVGNGHQDFNKLLE